MPAAATSGIKVDNNQKKKASSFPQSLKYNVIKGELREETGVIKMRLKSFLVSSFMATIGFIFWVQENAAAEDWALVQPGYEINLYSDRDYYHLDLLNCLEYWRMKTVFSDGSSVIQRYEVNWKTHEVKKI